MKAPDGTLVALEVLLFPEAMRGTGEATIRGPASPRA